MKHVTLTAEYVAYPTLIYNANNGTGTPSNTESTDSISEGQTKKLTVNKSTFPTRSGYHFLGYSTSNTDTSALYVPGDDITVKYDDPKITLYAIWGQMINKLTTVTTMQAMTSTICANTSTPTMWDVASAVNKATLKDNRDSKSYVVAKLRDGRCWMIQDLLLGSTSSAISLTTANSDVNANRTLPKAGDYTNYSNGVTTYGGHFYYNWTVATSGIGNSSYTRGATINYSICPKNWRLPTYDMMNDYIKYHNINLTSSYQTLGGWMWNNSSVPQEYNIYSTYWTSTASTVIYDGASKNTTFPWNAKASKTNVSVGSGLGPDGNLQIRCVAR